MVAGDDTPFDMPTARFSFDPGAGALLWAADAATDATYGQPIDLDSVDVSDALRREAQRLIDWFDTSWNVLYPPDPGPWRLEECARFNSAARRFLTAMKEELGPGWVIIDRFKPLQEDPELDRYLTDPAGFRRRT